MYTAVMADDDSIFLVRFCRLVIFATNSLLSPDLESLISSGFFRIVPGTLQYMSFASSSSPGAINNTMPLGMKLLTSGDSISFGLECIIYMSFGYLSHLE